MAYQAIANGARGLVFFGGHLTEVMSPADARAGWNWSFWSEALRPLVAGALVRLARARARRACCEGDA